MEVNGLFLAFLDIPDEYTEEYNRWYDLDHLPEHVSKGDVVTGRRYVAPKHLRDLPRTVEAEVFGGYPPYLTIYGFGGPIDMMSDEAAELWRVKDRGIVKQGRFWVQGRSTGGAKFRLARSVARAGVLVSEDAVPHLPHRGVIVAYGRAPSPDRRDEALAWWRDVHLPDLLTVPGVLGAMRGDPVDADDDHLVHVILCEDAPRDVMARVDAALRYAGASGRYPAHREAYVPEAFLAYDRIVPFEYDFDFGG